MEPVSLSQVKYVSAYNNNPVKFGNDLTMYGYLSERQDRVDEFIRQDRTEKKLGVAALAATLLIAAPTAYYAGRKGGSKSVTKKVEGKVKDLVENIKGLQNEIKKLTEKQEAFSAAKDGTIIVSKKAQLTSQLMGLGTVTLISEYIKNNREDLKGLGYSDDEITEAEQSALNVINDKSGKEVANEAARRVNEAVQIARSAEGNANRALGLANNMGQQIETATNRANEAISIASSGVSPITAKYLKPYYGLNLLQVLEHGKKIDQSRTEEVMKSIQEAASTRLHRSASETVSAIKAYKEKFPELTATWSITAEYKPIKKGGLGDVPVDIQDNFTKLGIDTPQFVPMYLKANESEFKELPNGDYIYQYGTNGYWKLNKMAEMSISTYRNGATSPEKVEFYVAELPVEGSDMTKKLIFVKNDNYFNENLYDSTLTAEETEKFAFLSKAVYMLAKVKVNNALNSGEKEFNCVKDLKINSSHAFDNLKAPNSMILNDWHAGTIAGLCRYRAPMEYNYREIPKNTYEALKDMPLLEIGHNLSCQGKTIDGEGNIESKYMVAENVINTLFDNHAIAIAENAHSGLTVSENVCNTVLLERTEGGKHFNSLFMGVALSDWFVPVSKNYSKEIIEDGSKSHILQALLHERQLSGDRENTIGGIVNGTDKHKHDMNAVSQKNYVPGLVLEKYDKTTDANLVMERRAKNKQLFYNAYIKPVLMDKNYKNAPEIIGGDMNISEEDFVNAPFIAFAHRLTSQKGAAILKGAIFKLFDNWEALPFKDKPKPYFLVGGPPESEEELAHLNALKNSEWGINKKDRIDHTIVLKGNMPNPAIMSAAQFFCAPSTFEPCGLIQGEAFAKGTPVLTTRTGGFVDTVTDGKTGFLSDISEEAYYDTLVKALDVYYNKPEEYKSMVMNALNIDFSWAQEGKKGPIFEYTEKLGFDTEKLPDIGKKAS